MKIGLTDFGPIRNLDFDIQKDLNVLFGKNNIGKSYAIICYYLILKNLSFNNLNNPFELTYFYYKDYINFNKDQIPYSLDRIEEEFEKTTKKLRKEYFSKDIKDYNVNELVKHLLKVGLEESFLVSLQKSFSSSFDSLKSLSNSYSGEKFEIKLDTERFSFVISPSDDFEDLIVKKIELEKDFYLRKIKINRDNYEKKNEIYIYYNDEKDNQIDHKEILYSPLVELFNSLLNDVNEKISNIYFLPASRSGLYQALSTFSSIVAELSKSRKFLTEKLELPNITDPVSDYFLYLSNMEKEKTETNYSELANDFENELLNGRVSINEESNKIVFRPDSIDTDLDLSYTSSMVSEIAPIVAFLKYIIGKEKANQVNFFSRIFHRGSKTQTEKAQNLIFIEEPEAHLHPEIQVKLMELFSRLVKRDIKIIMTTHSNYIFNKMSNLIMANKLNKDSVDCILLELGDKGSYVDPENMQVDELGIVDDNFVQTSENLFREREEILKNND